MVYSPKSRSDVFCFKLNFKISKSGYLQLQLATPDTNSQLATGKFSRNPLRVHHALSFVGMQKFTKNLRTLLYVCTSRPPFFLFNQAFLRKFEFWDLSLITFRMNVLPYKCNANLAYVKNCHNVSVFICFSEIYLFWPHS